MIEPSGLVPPGLVTFIFSTANGLRIMYWASELAEKAVTT